MASVEEPVPPCRDGCERCAKHLRVGGVVSYNNWRSFGGMCELDVNAPQPQQRIVLGRTPAWELVQLDIDRTHLPVPQRVRDDMKARDIAGRIKYGVPLTAGDGRNHLVDAYQELLDFTVYLRQELDERGLVPGEQVTDDTSYHLIRMFTRSLANLVALRGIIDDVEAARASAS